jgi:SOUL heme-binding protein
MTFKQSHLLPLCSGRVQPLLKYFDGDNEERIKLDYTTPLSLSFIPTVGKDGTFDGVLRDFNITFLIPSAYAVREAHNGSPRGRGGGVGKSEQA